MIIKSRTEAGCKPSASSARTFPTWRTERPSSLRKRGLWGGGEPHISSPGDHLLRRVEGDLPQSEMNLVLTRGVVTNL